MNRHITVEWPYESITLEFRGQALQGKPPAPLRSDYWRALERAESRLYRSEHGTHGYTDVMNNDGDQHLLDAWGTAWIACEAQLDGDESDREGTLIARTAARVAASFAVLNFGTEFLLK